ncbi:MAG: dephospho-CoA kinase [Planctomycetales bacterium]|nr:dephospho-CoA kinase [Planctomycetales bacterium]
MINRPFVIGLVGGIASGKSSVAHALVELGAVLIDADEIARRVTDLPLVLQQLCREFGDSILTPEGKLNRKSLAALVFGDQEGNQQQRLRLEDIVHPLVKQDICCTLAHFQSLPVPPLAIILDIPLLIETGWESSCDFIIYIDTPRSSRIRRANERGWSEEELLRREHSQLPLEEKRKSATHIFPNDDCDQPELTRRIRRLWDQMLASVERK